MVKLLSMHLCASQWHKSLSYKDKYFGGGMEYAADFNSMFGYEPPYQVSRIISRFISLSKMRSKELILLILKK